MLIERSLWLGVAWLNPVGRRMILAQSARYCDTRTGEDGTVDLRRTMATAGLALLLGACEREEKMVREDLPMARATRAAADVQSIAGAIGAYHAACGGALPESLEALTRQTMVSGMPCGPVLGSLPTPPAGWSAYTYSREGEAFTVTSSSGAQTVKAP
jgi:hypothetical protein